MGTAEKLDSHLQRSHPELKEAGFEVQANGRIKYPLELLNNVLRVLKYQPKYVNNVLKKLAENKLKELENKE